MLHIPSAAVAKEQSTTPSLIEMQEKKVEEAINNAIEQKQSCCLVESMLEDAVVENLKSLGYRVQVNDDTHDSMIFW